jgi:hypothetical protein
VAVSKIGVSLFLARSLLEVLGLSQSMASASAKKDDDQWLRVLSFDVGIRHLAYCDIRFRKAAILSHAVLDRIKDAQIDAWDIIDLDRVPSVDVCCKRLTEQLYKRFEFQDFDVVLIERQPKHRSIMMVAIQMFLCNYFHVAKVVNSKSLSSSKIIKFMHASQKLECHDRQENDNRSSVPYHHQRGRFVRRARTKEDRAQDAARYKDNKRRAITTCTHYLPKKDDLCDAFLQAVAYVESLRS